MIRQPIVAVLGHVDHGKTTLLDRIRGTAVAAREAGGITQHIGATEVPIDVIEKLCGGLLKQLKVELTIPGLLFIDTPGHEAFTSLRRRGGALADLAVLVVDINEGFKAQTVEAVEILREHRTPFIVAANKIDRIHGWVSFENFPFSHALLKQNEEVKQKLENLLYMLVGDLHKLGFNSERFDRVKEFERQVAIVPVSALTGEGIPELLMLLTGLAQKFLGRKLDINTEKPGRGTVLEVKEEVGLGTTLDVIVYEGRFRRGDTIVVAGRDGIVVTRVRSLLKPKPLDEIRDPRHRFQQVQEVHASAGVKITAPKLESVIAGSPVMVAEDVERAVEELRSEIAGIRIATEKLGVVLKADTLGSLEALAGMLGRRGIPVRYADVGDVARRDVLEAEAVREESPELGVVLGFNVRVRKDAEARANEKGVPIIVENVIYRLVEEYEMHVEMEKAKLRAQEFEKLARPAKVQVIQVFRMSKPAIVGVEVLAGTLRPRVRLMNENGRAVGSVKSIEERGESLQEAKKGMQVGVSIEGGVVGRNLEEGDVLLVDMPEADAKLISQKYREFLSEDEVEALEDILRIKRRDNPFWAVGE
ncbi:MAG: translation initiation factor IF-2 [Euryarchaeota archaeon]|nr:translation initiation factor IF-2 [Euryarchaeota archaeon]